MNKVFFLMSIPICLLTFCNNKEKSNSINKNDTTVIVTRNKILVDNCYFAFGIKAAIECAKIATSISGYSEDWPKGTNSTIFFQLAENNLNLKEINFCFIVIDSIPSSIAKITNLEKLYLTHGTIKNIPSSIGQLKHLKELVLGTSKDECGGNKVIYISTEIANCTELEYLGLAYSEINDLPLELNKCTKLKTIDLFQNTQINLKKLNELRKRFPGVEIISHLK